MSFNQAISRVAAKPHRCEWCFDSIDKGITHIHFAGLWQGEFQNWRMHQECYADAGKGDDLEDGFMPGEHQRPAKALAEGK